MRSDISDSARSVAEKNDEGPLHDLESSGAESRTHRNMGRGRAGAVKTRRVGPLGASFRFRLGSVLEVRYLWEDPPYSSTLLELSVWELS